MTSLDVTRLSPDDARAALRSYPRRFREAFAPIDEDEDVDELATATGPDGRSAAGVAADVARTWVVLRDALREVVVNDTPILPPSVVDADQRRWQAPPPPLAEALDQLTHEADELVQLVEHVPGESWTRSGTIPDGPAVGALELLQEAVRVGHDGLRDVERTLADARA
jgi:hypothetical protein